MLVPLGLAFPSALTWLITREVASLQFAAQPAELSQNEGDFFASAVKTRG